MKTHPDTKPYAALNCSCFALVLPTTSEEANVVKSSFVVLGKSVTDLCVLVVIARVDVVVDVVVKAAGWTTIPVILNVPVIATLLPGVVEVEFRIFLVKECVPSTVTRLLTNDPVGILKTMLTIMSGPNVILILLSGDASADLMSAT